MVLNQQILWNSCQSVASEHRTGDYELSKRFLAAMFAVISNIYRLKNWTKQMVSMKKASKHAPWKYFSQIKQSIIHHQNMD